MLSTPIDQSWHVNWNPFAISILQDILNTHPHMHMLKCKCSEMREFVCLVHCHNPQCFLHWRWSINICWLKPITLHLLKIKMEGKQQDSMELSNQCPLLTQEQTWCYIFPTKKSITLLFWEGTCVISSGVWWLREGVLEPHCLDSNLAFVTYKLYGLKNYLSLPQIFFNLQHGVGFEDCMK